MKQFPPSILSAALQFEVNPSTPCCHRQVKIVDGRTLIGDFQCLDPEGNLVLANTMQRMPVPNGAAAGSETERPVGMVIIPPAQQAEVHVEVS